MRTSESVAKIAPALLAAQKAITFAAKDSLNPHFKSKYADLPCVIDAVKPALNEAGIVFIQSASPSEPGYLAMTTRLMHQSGEWIEDTATLPLPKADPQGYGSASTYARRYGLAAICGLYQDDDDGNAAQKPATQAPTPVPPMTLNDEQIASIEALASEVNVPLKKILDKAGVSALNEIPRLAYQSIISKLEASRKQA